MTIFDMLNQSGILTLLGVGIVFSFLIILVFAISLTGKIIGKFVKTQSGLQPACCSTNNSSAANGGGGNNGAITAAISAAVNEYRKINN